MLTFTLDPRLESDSVFVRALALSQVRIQNQTNVPWLILVPQRTGVREIIDLSPADRATLMEEIAQVSRVLDHLYAPDKINVAALGNVVPQLHVHVIARFTTDPAWPAPVWGRIAPEPYTTAALADTMVSLQSQELWQA